MKNHGFTLPLFALTAALVPCAHAQQGQQDIPPVVQQDLSPTSVEDIPPSVQGLRQAGPLNVELRTNTGSDVHLRLDTDYITQEPGNRLTDEQIEKLDTIRSEAPDKYQILSSLFPQQIAEFLLRTPSAKPPASPAPAPADDPIQRAVWEIASDYLSQPRNPAFSEGQRRARADFIKASLESLPPQPAPIRHLLEQACQYEDPDFSSPEKASTFQVLNEGYSPWRRVGMSIVGDTLRIDGAVVTERLGTDAAAAGMSPEEYANDYYSRYNVALNRWRSAQITGNAYAGSIRSFLNDPRLAEFTPEEVSRAYQRVFGRDLKTDLEADRIAARLGHPVTYAQLRSESFKE
jgi:hypothetical protein